MTFFIWGKGMIRFPPDQIGLNYLCNCQRLFNFMELLTFNELLSCTDQIRDNAFLESTLKCFKTDQKWFLYDHVVIKKPALWNSESFSRMFLLYNKQAQILILVLLKYMVKGLLLLKKSSKTSKLPRNYGSSKLLF